MQNSNLIQALNGIAIAAANVGDVDCVNAMDQCLQIAAAVIPVSRLYPAGLPVTQYDATTGSATVFLTNNAGLTTNVGGKTSPQFDGIAAVAKQLGVSIKTLGG